MNLPKNTGHDSQSPDETQNSPSQELSIKDRLTLRIEELPGLFGVSRRTIERQLAAGRFPKPDQKMGKIPLWSLQKLRRWAEGGGK